MIEKRVQIRTGKLTLAGIIHPPAAESGIAVVVCHPHPLYGGSMHNNVVEAICEALTQQHIAALRFNFRGVPGSEGQHEQGQGEQDDVRAAVSFLQSGDPSYQRIGVVGYSFGAFVGAAAACGDDRVQALGLVSPPAQMYDFGFLKQCLQPKLIVSGTDDDFTPPTVLEALFVSLPEPKRLSLENTDHFWFGKEKTMALTFAQFFAKALA